MTSEMFGELVRYRGLLGMLAWRDIRVRYKQSVIGIAWAFFMPLIQAVVLFTIFSFGFKGDGITGGTPWKMPYFLFVLSGVIPWSFFAGGVNSSIESLTRNARLVTKIYFPREVFPLGSVVASMVDFAIGSLVLIVPYIYFMAKGLVRPSALILILPLVILIQVFFVAGLTLILSMANLFFRDVKYIMTFMLQLWFFATNVMYPIEFSSYPKLKLLLNLNPMIGILDAYRDAIAGTYLRNPGSLAFSAVIALVVFFFGWRIFHKAEFKFAEYV